MKNNQFCNSLTCGGGRTNPAKECISTEAKPFTSFNCHFILNVFNILVSVEQSSNVDTIWAISFVVPFGTHQKGFAPKRHVFCLVWLIYHGVCPAVTVENQCVANIRMRISKAGSVLFLFISKAEVWINRGSWGHWYLIVRSDCFICCRQGCQCFTVCSFDFFVVVANILPSSHCRESMCSKYSNEMFQGRFGFIFVHF